MEGRGGKGGRRGKEGGGGGGGGEWRGEEGRALTERQHMLRYGNTAHDSNTPSHTT